MDSLRNISSSSSKQEIEKVEENDDQRINIWISRKAYDALEKFTKELNQGESGGKKLFNVEEILDEEILLLFSDEWNKE
jgi:hypothetical protein